MIEREPQNPFFRGFPVIFYDSRFFSHIGSTAPCRVSCNEVFLQTKELAHEVSHRGGDFLRPLSTWCLRDFVFGGLKNQLMKVGTSDHNIEAGGCRKQGLYVVSYRSLLFLAKFSVRFLLGPDSLNMVDGSRAQLFVPLYCLTHSIVPRRGSIISISRGLCGGSFSNRTALKFFGSKPVDPDPLSAICNVSWVHGEGVGIVGQEEKRLFGVMVSRWR